MLAALGHPHCPCCLASEGIESFNTDLVRSECPAGAVGGDRHRPGPEPSGESFTIETFRRLHLTPSKSPPRRSTCGASPCVDNLRRPSATSHLGDHVAVVRVALRHDCHRDSEVLILAPHAGGHPDLTTSFKLKDPGAPEAAQNVIFNAPTGVFGNPRAITQCAPPDFALDQCPPNSQAGLITVRANYEGNPTTCSAPLRSSPSSPPKAKPRASPSLSPSSISRSRSRLQVRTTTDYGLRFTVQDITQLTPLAAAKLTFWGFPAAESHEARTLPQRAPRATQPAAPKKKAPPASQYPPQPASSRSR